MNTTDAATAAGFARLEERTARGDGEAESALIILNWARPKAEGFVDVDGIYFDGMLSAHDGDDVREGSCKNPREGDESHCGCGPYLSASEELLLRLAWNLWSGGSDSFVNIARLLDILDDETLAVALSAIEARRGGRLPIHSEVGR